RRALARRLRRRRGPRSWTQGPGDLRRGRQGWLGSRSAQLRPLLRRPAGGAGGSREQDQGTGGSDRRAGGSGTMSVETIMEEVAQLTLEEMQRLQTEVEAATRTRYVREHAEEQIDKVNRQIGEQLGRKLGDAWQQPTGATDAYPTGAVVTHGGTTWRSLTPGNVWEPGVSGWREISEDEVVPPEFVQPTGAHDAYGIGDRVSWSGSVWRSTIEGNVWKPQDYPQGWVEEASIPEGMGPPPIEEEEPPAEGTYPEWT